VKENFTKANRYPNRASPDNRGRNVERGGRDRVEGNDSKVGRMFERKEMLNRCLLAGKPTADTSTVVYSWIEVQGFSCQPKDD
jgi:hypothetical protein